MAKHTIFYWTFMIVSLLVAIVDCVSLIYPIRFLSGYAEYLLMILIGQTLGVSAMELYLVLNRKGGTDGALIAGAEDEDGLVFALETPVEELVKKDRVVFEVLHAEMEVREQNE